MIERKYMSQCIESDYCKGWNDAVDAIGRCKDCMWGRETTKEDYTESGRDVILYKDALECEFCQDARWRADFCSCFKKRAS